MAFPRRFWTRLFNRFLRCGIDTSYILTIILICSKARFQSRNGRFIVGKLWELTVFECRSKNMQGCCTAARPLVGRDSLSAKIWQEEPDNTWRVYGESITPISPTIAWFLEFLAISEVRWTKLRSKDLKSCRIDKKTRALYTFRKAVNFFRLFCAR